MAKNSKMKCRESQNISCSLYFDGILQSGVRGSLVIEMVKYLMYERQQLPLPFEHVKRDLNKHKQQSESSTEQARRKNVSHNLEIKRISKVIESLDAIFMNVLTGFDVCPEIQEILVVLGSTIVSPKETYLISMPLMCPESDGLPLKVCVKSLFKQIITQDIIQDLKKTSCTKLHVLVKAHRHCGLPWFLPKPMYKPSTRGQHCHINFESRSLSTTIGQHDLTQDEIDVEISGIEPFNISDLNDISLSSMSESSQCTSATDIGSVGLSTLSTLNATDCDISASSTAISTNQGSISEVNEPEYIWFQAPINVKGYRAKHKGIHT